MFDITADKGDFMTVDWLDSLPLIVLPMSIAVLLLIALEIGYRLGRWRHVHYVDEKDIPVGAMVGSVLGLLALVLGFTFSLAASRFDARRLVVLDEANAIGTTYLRSQFLESPQREEVGQLLREYVDLRIMSTERSSKVADMVSKSESVQAKLWQDAVKASATAPRSIPVGLFVESLNEMIDLHAKRLLAGLRSRVPVSIWIALTSLAFLSMAAVGYQSGLAATRRSPAMVGLVIAFSSVIFLIADLDRGQEGFLQVSQQALIDVKRSMEVHGPLKKDVTP